MKRRHRVLRAPVVVSVLGLGILFHYANLPAQDAKTPELAAVLAVASGDVVIKRGETVVEASYGAPLLPGDVVETGKGAEAAVLFESGQIIELGSGSRITISAIPGRDVGGAVVAENAIAGSLDRFTQSDLGGDGLSVLPELRSAGGEVLPEPLFPRQTLVRAEPITLSWLEVDDALEYKVTLSGESGRSSHRALEASLGLPEGVVLEPGASWTWSVEAVTTDGVPLSSRPTTFEVAPVELAKELADLETRLEPLLSGGDPTRADAALYLLGSYCRNVGFYGDAIRHVAALAAKHPERGELHRDLGSLYQAVGRDDLAAESYKRALKK